MVKQKKREGEGGKTKKEEGRMVKQKRGGEGGKTKKGGGEGGKTKKGEGRVVKQKKGGGEGGKTKKRGNVTPSSRSCSPSLSLHPLPSSQSFASHVHFSLHSCMKSDLLHRLRV